jgi:hypothetical protein
MPALTVRGLHNADTASVYSSDEVGTIDDTFLFPKWWDKKANNVEYIRCFKLHVTFRFDYHRGVKRMALTAHNSTEVTAEYIFPTRVSQQPTYREYGAGPVVCFAATPVGSWATFVFEHRPNLDLGGYEPADGFYDLNLENDVYDLN